MKHAISIDVGGTNTRVALVDEDYKVVNRHQFRTDTYNPFKTISEIKEIVSTYKCEIVGVGISCPGPLDLINGKILSTPNLHGEWHNFHIKERLEQELGLSVYLENDANLAALAEAYIGEGKNYNIVQYLTISTGIGAGLVINKKIFHGAHGFANEVANTCLKNNGPSHGMIYPGGIEALSSGTAIEERAREIGLTISHAGEVNDLALKGNLDAELIMNEAKLYLSNYIAGIVGYTDPDIIILGGSVALKIPRFVKEVEELVKTKVYDAVKEYVDVRKSSLNDDNGLIGAACLVFSNIDFMN